MRFPAFSFLLALPSFTVALDSAPNLPGAIDSSPALFQDGEISPSKTEGEASSLGDKYDQLLAMVDTVKQDPAPDLFDLPKQVKLMKEMESFNATVDSVDSVINAILDENNDLMIPQFQELLLAVQDKLAQTRSLASSIAEMEIAALDSRAPGRRLDESPQEARIQADGTVTFDLSEAAATQKTKDLHTKIHSKLDPGRKVKTHPRFKRHFDLHDAFQKGSHGYIQQKIEHFHKKAAPSKKQVEVTNNATIEVDYEEDYVDSDGQRRRRLNSKNVRREHCEQMVGCLSTWSLYDLVVYFYGPYVNDDGEISDEAESKLDKGMYGQIKRITDVMKKFDKKNFYKTKNLDNTCRDLLGKFHQIQNHDEKFLEYHGSTWTSVCRAEGATKYIMFSEIRDKVGASNERKAIADQVHEEYVACAMKLGEKSFFDKSGAPRLPTGLNSRARNGHYQPKSPYNSNNNFKFETLSVMQSAESTNSFKMPKDFAKFWKTGNKNKSIEPDWYSWSKKQNGYTKKSAHYKDRDTCRMKVDKHYKGEFEKKPSVIFEGGKKRTYDDLKIRCKISGSYTVCNVYSGKKLVCHEAQFRNKDIGDRCPADSIIGAIKLPFISRGRVKTKTIRFPCDQERVYKVETIFRSATDMDKSAALFVGEKVSVGSVCAHAETTGKVPGFCCVEQPYQRSGDFWGTEFSCDLGESKCKSKASGLAGFSQESCSAYSGKFCAYHRDCSTLKTCVAEEVKWATGKKKQAYLAYVSEAPELEDTGDADQCGQVRVYFGFEEDFPDDEEICEDVQFLREKTEFNNLDSFLGSGSSGGGEISANDGGETEELNAPEEPEVQEKALDKLSKTIYVFDQTLNSLEEFYSIAADFECPEDLTGGVKTVCAVAKNVLVVVATVAFFVSKRVFSSLEDSYPGFEDFGWYEIYSQTMVSYDNMVILNGGIAAIKGQNVDNTEALADHIDDRVDTLKDHVEEVITEHIDSVCGAVRRQLGNVEPSKAKFAGCDGHDQDGDGVADNCEEDLFPPTLSFSSALEFVNNGETNQLQGKVFRDANEALSLFRGATNIVDDCSLAQDLDVKMAVQESGVCQSAISMTPVQRCNDREVLGLSKQVVVQMDTQAPEVTCGFEGSQMGDKKTLVVEEGSDIFDAGFVYQVDDSCSKKVALELSVNSNEFDGSNDNVHLAKTRDRKTMSINPQVFVKPSRCASSKGGFCVNDAIEQRIYEITLKATDEAGWISKDVCRVIVVPKKEATEERELRGVASVALSEKESAKLVTDSQKSYEIASTSWTNIIQK
ncbi:expressed unknown protein [Seminavis robusta]|uniref:Uncharacterized protein n=1 Tax=Seminavis robusta TaxID=568900 RepID=A0A9N8DYP2_9STRA|nr:expressed unknown protein [Seminavis robusta]|eukprot:Sro481_g151530.1 n/a (1287) ;mRNA; f:18725-23966